MQSTMLEAPARTPHDGNGHGAAANVAAAQAAGASAPRGADAGQEARAPPASSR
jgi:hypothetical protein